MSARLLSLLTWSSSTLRPKGLRHRWKLRRVRWRAERTKTKPCKSDRAVSSSEDNSTSRRSVCSASMVKKFSVRCTSSASHIWKLNR